jgi:hypothetical protein
MPLKRFLDFMKRLRTALSGHKWAERRLQHKTKNISA